MIQPSQNYSGGPADFDIRNPGEALEEQFADIPEIHPDAPRVCFPSDLVLTRRQEDRLLAKVKEWDHRLDEQLGRSETGMEGSSLPTFLANYSIPGEGEPKPERKFMAKRQLFQMMYQGDMSFRPILFPGSIYRTSNQSIPIVKRIVDQMGARAVNYFFGTDPWFALYPIGGEEDKKFSDSLQKLTEIKCDESGSTAAIRGSVINSFIIGEVVNKVTQESRRDFYKEFAIVAVDGEGKPLLAMDGDPITQQDTFTLDPESGMSFLARDGQTPIPDPESLNFQRVLLEKEIDLYKGPNVTQIYYRDFLCPENAPTVQDAECVIHITERSLSNIAGAFMQSPGRSLEDVQKAVNTLRDAMGGGNLSKSGDRGPRAELGQWEEIEAGEPTDEYGEAYIRGDWDGDFIQEDVMVVYNRRTFYPVYYNYVGAVTDDGKRPFHVIRNKPVLNRWYGIGAIEEFESIQETVDLLVNRRNISQGDAGHVQFWQPELTVEGQHNPNLAMNSRRTWTKLDPKMPSEQIYESIAKYDIKFDALTSEIQFWLQMITNCSGVSNANDGNMAGLDTTELATGVRNVEKSGQELFGVRISELNTCLTPLLQAFVTTQFSNLDDEETFMYLEGDVPTEMTISRRQIETLRFNVRILLTRYKDEQAVASMESAMNILDRYDALLPDQQIIRRPLVRDALKAYQVQNPDQYVVPKAAPIPLPGGSGGVEAPLEQSNQSTPNL